MRLQINQFLIERLKLQPHFNFIYIIFAIYMRSAFICALKHFDYLYLIIRNPKFYLEKRILPPRLI